MDLNKEIIKLWKEELKNKDIVRYLRRVPQFYFLDKKTKHKQNLLYVGINPSFSYKSFFDVMSKLKERDKKLWMLLKNRKRINQFYSWHPNKITRQYLADLQQIDDVFFRNFNYFNKARKIADDLMLNFQPADLFLFRATAQREIRSIVFSNKKEVTLTNFAKKQIDIFFEFLKEIHPRVILVGNALASDILLSYFKQRLTWDDKLGTDVLKLNNYKVPIFFSGMLSGQRALDKYSMKRLEWAIKRSINNSRSKN